MTQQELTPLEIFDKAELELEMRNTAVFEMSYENADKIRAALSQNIDHLINSCENSQELADKITDIYGLPDDNCQHNMHTVQMLQCKTCGNLEYQQEQNTTTTGLPETATANLEPESTGEGHGRMAVGGSLIEMIDGALDEVSSCELNMSNYHHDDVGYLNNGFITLYGTLEEIKSALQLPSTEPKSAQLPEIKENGRKAMAEVLIELCALDVKGHSLGSRLQFSETGRTLLAKIDEALAEYRGEPV